MDQITIFYFGSAYVTTYKAKVTTSKQLKKWKQQRHKNIKDVAFILAGRHTDIASYELTNYLCNNNLEKLSLYQF